MSTPDPAAASAREAARAASGQFGVQARAEADVTLDDQASDQASEAPAEPDRDPVPPHERRRKPHFDPDAKPKKVKVTTYTGDKTFEVTLRPRATLGWSESWEAFAADGYYLGTVEKYTGSIDRRIPIGGRHLRQPGKQRTLWSYQDPAPRSRAMTKQMSQAACLRGLLEDRKREEEEVRRARKAARDQRQRLARAMREQHQRGE